MKKGIEQRNIEIAKSLLKNNVSIDIIMDSTGFSKEKIESLSEGTE
jgi:predicted transposase/invertase (TIGR01784 family)